jgi:cell division protein FtsW (lipid II flippase)
MDKIQRRLFVLAAVFLGLYSLALSLSPAVLARSWQTDYRWNHWLGYCVWLVGYLIVLGQSARKLPSQDPFLLPLVGLLSGWGLLTIWRLTGHFGTRQTIWLGLALAVLIVGMNLKTPLHTLRRYKYIWLTGGLLLTALTLVFGTNPLGYGPRLWLGCCGVYLQPSEPLKLLLVVFLSAYLADWQSVLVASDKGQVASTPAQDSGRSALSAPLFPRPAFQLQILIPTLLMTGIALALLVVQRDLGTASVFIAIYSTMIYLATGWRLIPFISALSLGLAGLAGYTLFDVVRLRVEAWINPWLDPSGRSYQIVQSLISIANGGIFGRGPGLGSPNVVPIAHSDFIFSTIVEETGLVGALALLIILGLFLQRGIRTALRANNPYQRYLAGGLTAFLVAQSILIMGGNLRLLPLTGVTLPFVSYGGSSLLVSYIALYLLLHISAQTEDGGLKTEAQTLAQGTLLPITALLLGGLVATALVNGWWSYARGPDLLTRTDNPRRAIADQTVQRGALLDRQNTPLVQTHGQPGDFTRTTLTPQLGPVLGYNNPVYGQTGLEQGLDDTLRGQLGHDPLTIWWHHLLYGQPPPGLDVRLTLDMQLQTAADALLSDQIGALIMLNAQSGEILVMASYPTYNPNELEDIWDQLIQNQDAPLLNRAIQGRYTSRELERLLALESNSASWRDPVQLRLPGGEAQLEDEISSPMNMALLAASLSNEGLMPAAQIAQAYRDPQDHWILLPALGEALQLIPPAEARSITNSLKDANTPTWHMALSPEGEDLTWYIGGTTSAWEGTPYALVIIIEEDNLELADQTGQAMLAAAMLP